MSENANPNADFVITAYAQNAHIIRVMGRMQINKIGKSANPSMEDLCKILRIERGDNKKGLSKLEQEIRNLVGLKLVPQKPDGGWIEAALILSELLSTPPTELWPGQLATTIPHQRSDRSELIIGQATSWIVM